MSGFVAAAEEAIPSPTAPGTVREAISWLHHARHWATISIAWHTDDAAARASYDKTSDAIRLIEPLGEQAGRCYFKPY